MGVETMTNITKALLLLVTAVAASDARPQESTISNRIAQAKLEDSLAEYAQSPLCAKEELTLWTCDTGKRVYSLCSSRVVDRTSGYMQYRAASRGKLVLEYPEEKKPPLGLFKFYAGINGDTSLDFTIDGHGYSLVDPLRSNSSIVVSFPSGRSAEIECGGNQTLQLNYTMRLMHDSGVWSRD
jgi:hypothetical protein